MEDTTGVIAAFIFALFVGLFSGLISYAAATDTVRNEALAAKAGCWKVPEQGERYFSWDCK